ncbi:MAG: YceD family protein [Gallionella sp.]|nr:YceD family protein [Gallionella sp.]
MYARPFIDSLEFAGSGKQIHAQASFEHMPRLLDLLENSQGVLNYTLQGRLDSLGRPVLDVSITGNCQLTCQRCLNGMDYAIRHEARLVLCDQAALDVLDDEEEEFEGILADAHLDVLALLEDEILLALPIAARHDLGACHVAEGEGERKDERHPFAVLEKLKRN